MAYDKIIPIHRRLDHCLAYAVNEHKTELATALDYIGNEQKTVLPCESRLLTGINCNAETAYREMQETKRRWDKRGGILGYHIIHAYAPGEVTPQEAHEAGVEFARRLLGEKYEAVVATHLDRKHLHCHIVFNSVSLVDGGKYRSDFKSYFGTLRSTSNAVSHERGLSVIEPERRGKHYAEWDAEQHGRPTVRGAIRTDVDAAILRARSFSDFFALLRTRGYEVKTQGKYLAVKPSGASRYVRLKSLGEDYSEDAIRTRLAVPRAERSTPRQPEQKPSTAKRYRAHAPMPPRKKVKGFHALYLYYCYLLRGRRSKRARPAPFPIRQEAAKLRRYQRQFQFLRENRIETMQELSMLHDALQAQIDALTERRKILYEWKRRSMDVTQELAEVNAALRQARRSLNLCRAIEDDAPRLQTQAQQAKSVQPEEMREPKKHSRQKYYGR